MTTPYISLVTPAFNAEGTVTATLESVRAAKTPATEYIFVDGASTDRTVELVRSYGDLADILVSEPDQGQYYALAKGLAMARGEVQGWINADDIIMPWTLKLVEKLFRKYEDIDWITGLPAFLDGSGTLVKLYTKPAAYPQRLVRNGWFDRAYGGYLQQENMFWRRSLYERAGGLDLSLSLAADFALWTAFANFAELVPVDVPLAAFRELPGEQRSSRQAVQYDAEVRSVQALKQPIGWAWRAAAARGRSVGALARLLITAPASLITYDRIRRDWKIVRRRRSISRQSLSTLFDIRG